MQTALCPRPPRRKRNEPHEKHLPAADNKKNKLSDDTTIHFSRQGLASPCLVLYENFRNNIRKISAGKPTDIFSHLSVPVQPTEIFK